MSDTDHPEPECVRATITIDVDYIADTVPGDMKKQLQENVLSLVGNANFLLDSNWQAEVWNWRAYVCLHDPDVADLEDLRLKIYKDGDAVKIT